MWLVIVVLLLVLLAILVVTGSTVTKRQTTGAATPTPTPVSTPLWTWPNDLRFSPTETVVRPSTGSSAACPGLRPSFSSVVISGARNSSNTPGQPPPGEVTIHYVDGSKFTFNLNQLCDTPGINCDPTLKKWDIPIPEGPGRQDNDANVCYDVMVHFVDGDTTVTPMVLPQLSFTINAKGSFTNTGQVSCVYEMKTMDTINTIQV